MSVSGVYVSLKRKYCSVFSMNSQDRFIDWWLCRDVLFLASLFLQSIFCTASFQFGGWGGGRGLAELSQSGLTSMYPVYNTRDPDSIP